MIWKFIWGTAAVGCAALWVFGILLSMRVRPGRFPGYPDENRPCDKSCDADRQETPHEYACALRRFFHMYEVKTALQATAGVSSALAVLFGAIAAVAWMMDPG